MILPGPAVPAFRQNGRIGTIQTNNSRCEYRDL